MRTSFAIIPVLLFAAGVASAAEPTSDKGAQPNAQPAGSAQDARRHKAQDARGDQEQVVVAPRLTPANYPAFGNEQDEANCYYVFGALRCTRIQTRNSDGTNK